MSKTFHKKNFDHFDHPIRAKWDMVHEDKRRKSKHRKEMGEDLEDLNQDVKEEWFFEQESDH